MSPLNQALRGARHAAGPALRALESALVVGASGALGSALLREALVAGRFQRVAALVAEPLASGVRGFVPLPAAALPSAGKALGLALAFIVFERERHSNGRDDAFVRPDPGSLRELAIHLREVGVRRLIVVVPHAPALLPQALKHGLASTDEGALAAMGFEHLVFVRAAQDAAGVRSGTPLDRFARWWLSQLRWMVPSSEQPVRAARLAELVVLLARLLPRAAALTRVLPPEVLAQAAAGDAPEAALEQWLGSARTR